MDSCLDEVLIPVFVVLFGIGVLVVGGIWCENTFIDNVPSIVKVDGKIVYEGTSAGFDTASEGANTSVTVKGGFLYLFPQAYYVSRNVEVVGKK